MKLLVDQNLPRSLVKHFALEFPDSIHVHQLGLADSPDRAVWEHAQENGFTIITKDSDYQQLSFLLGQPPKVIWLACGNCSVSSIIALIRNHEPTIKQFEKDFETALLVVR